MVGRPPHTRSGSDVLTYTPAQPAHDDHRDEAHVHSLRLALGSILSPVSTAASLT